MKLFKLILGVFFITITIHSGFSQSTIMADTITSADTSQLGATVSPDRMNIMYRGIENPVSVSAPCCEYPIIVECKGGNIKGEKGKYIVIPTNEKKVIISVSQLKGDVKVLIGAYQFRVFPVPSPKVTWCNSLTGETVKAASAGKCPLIPMMEDYDFDVYATIDGFDIRYEFDGEIIERRGNKGNIIPKDLVDEVKKLPAGTKIYFDNIKVTVPGGEQRIQSAEFIVE